MSDINDFNITSNFKLKEFESPDTHEVKVHPKLLQLLQAIRNKLDSALIINSAYRTEEHNRKVGGVDDSQHRKGTAADISFSNLDLDADKLAEVVKNQSEKLNIGEDNLGIGKYNTFVHVDVRGLIGDEAPARWDNQN
ncbi:YcbK family protein [Sporohalobacter salinus]|uniref:YcbK family protein n=1 Tax=Sporohalobacter salinus TaxID=1494606 RepID=UPI001EF95D6C|nr:D-Ala-D-Ala carboxypeptidase family metallohydrolase [Sporohalobacter salinus]MBM7623632.1 uncharacterized protein YcbK (DUF882 family) [Sporohalobacter salinus]